MEITIKVLVRIAPQSISQCFSESSNDQQAKAAVEDAKRVSIFANGNSLHTTNPKDNIRDKEKDYTFDKIFDASATQEQVYGSLSEQVLEVLEGHNVNIFAYGAIAAGKTYTMHGSSSSPGILPRALQGLFDSIDSMKKQDSNSHFHVEISFIELYNASFRSLVSAKNNKKKNSKHKHADSIGSITEDLEPNVNSMARSSTGAPVPDGDSPASKLYLSGEKDKIDIHENELLGLFLSGDIRVPVSSADEAVTLFYKAEKHRAAKFITKYNPADGSDFSYAASRSHSIFTVYVESHRVVDSGHPPQLRLGKLNFIDLAGTDRLDKQTQLNAARSPEMTETKEINLSLNALGDVLFAISEQSKLNSKKRRSAGSGAHSYGSIPYRNSKLTHIMKESFGGNAVTVMVANLHSSAYYFNLARTTLEYATWAANTHNIVKENIVNMQSLSANQSDVEAQKIRHLMLARSKSISVARDTLDNDDDEISLIDVVDPDPHDIDMDEEMKYFGDVCMKCVELLAQIAILEKQVIEVKAEIALNEGLQRRVDAQVRGPERNAESLREAQEEESETTILKNLQTDRIGLDKNLEDLKTSYSRVLEELELHKSVSPFHAPKGGEDGDDDNAGKDDSTRPTDGSNQDHHDDSDIKPVQEQEKSLLQRLCCCCSLCDCCVIRD